MLLTVQKYKGRPLMRIEEMLIVSGLILMAVGLTLSSMGI
jgi:hypothetical protein